MHQFWEYNKLTQVIFRLEQNIMAGRRRYESQREYEYGQRSRRFWYRRRERRMEERRVELVTFAALILLFVFALLYPTAVKPNWIAIIGGAILVGSAIYQTQRRWRVNPTTWIGGGLMVFVWVMLLDRYSMPPRIFFPLPFFVGCIFF